MKRLSQLARLLRRHARLVADVVTLAGSRRGRLGNRLSGWRVLANQRRAPNARRAFPVRIGDHRFQLADRSELAGIREVFVSGDYAAARTDDPQTIVDLGANVGAAAVFLRDRFPGAHIYCVEANPLTYARLEENVAGIATPVLRAIGSQAGPVTFYAAVHSAGASLEPSPGAVELIVPGSTLSELFDELALDRVDLLKVDVEGAELDVLADSDGLARVRSLLLEVHGDLLGSRVDELSELLHDFEVAPRTRDLDNRRILTASRWRALPKPGPYRR